MSVTSDIDVECSFECGVHLLWPASTLKGNAVKVIHMEYIEGPEGQYFERQYRENPSMVPVTEIFAKIIACVDQLHNHHSCEVELIRNSAGHVHRRLNSV